MHKKISRSKGFTLIELVIVIVILGILAAVAVPKFVDMTQSANESTTRVGLATLRSAVKSFYLKKAILRTPRYPTTTSEIQSCIQGGRIPKNMVVTGSSSCLGDLPASPDFINTLGPFPPSTPSAYGWFYNSDTGEVWAGNDSTW